MINDLEIKLDPFMLTKTVGKVIYMAFDKIEGLMIMKPDTFSEIRDTAIDIFLKFISRFNFDLYSTYFAIGCLSLQKAFILRNMNIPQTIIEECYDDIFLQKITIKELYPTNSEEKMSIFLQDYVSIHSQFSASMKNSVDPTVVRFAKFLYLSCLVRNIKIKPVIALMLTGILMKRITQLDTTQAKEANDICTKLFGVNCKDLSKEKLSSIYRILEYKWML